MSRRFFGRGRRGRGPRVPNRWTSQIADGAAVGTAANYVDNLVNRSDYASNTTIEPAGGVILAGIRGYITVAPTVTTAFSLWMNIVVHDEDVNTAIGGPLDPAGFQPAIDERVIWWWSFRFPAAAAATPTMMMHFPVHIKTRVKLRDDHVFLIAVCTNAVAGNQATLTYNLRSNLRGASIT